jgi:hypothetical protein
MPYGHLTPRESNHRFDGAGDDECGDFSVQSLRRPFDGFPEDVLDADAGKSGEVRSELLGCPSAGWRRLLRHRCAQARARTTSVWLWNPPVPEVRAISP